MAGTSASRKAASSNTGAPPKKKLARSPLAPKRFVTLEPVAGVRLAGRAVGLKKHKGVKDLMVAELAPGTTVAGCADSLKMPVGAGRLVPGDPAARQRAGARRQFGQC